MDSGTEILTKVPELKYEETAPAIDAGEFRKVVESRRSIRVFDGSPVPEQTVRSCLELALLSPNSSNLQPWEFHWVRSSEKKAKLVKACFSQPAASTAAELIVCVARTGTWRGNSRDMIQAFDKAKTKIPAAAYAYYRRLAPFVYGLGPLGIFGLFKKLMYAVTGLVRPVPREPTSHSDMVVWATKTVALACQTLMLAFRAEGFDTCPLEGYDSRRVRKLLGLPSDASVTMVVAVGKRAPNGVYGPRLRFDKERFLKEI